MLRETISADAVCLDFWVTDGGLGPEESPPHSHNPVHGEVANMGDGEPAPSEMLGTGVKVVPDPFSQASIPLLEVCPESMTPERRGRYVEYLLDSIL